MDVADVYASALLAAEAGDCPQCELRRADGSVTTVDIARWVAPASPEELAALRHLPGPVLDVGCGPGRHVSALAGLGVECLGIDVLPAAVALARRRGARVLRASAFGPLPTDRWRAALLLDGNIGIGGDPGALLRRLHEIVGPQGRVLIELDARERRVYTAEFTLAYGELHSRPFRWTLVGHGGIRSLAAQTGYDVMDVVQDGERAFAYLAARPPARRRPPGPHLQS